MRQLVARLGVQPSDRLAAGKGQKTFHFPDLDASLHRDAILRGRQRWPIDRDRHLIEVAITFGPLRVVGERASALVIEKAQEVSERAPA